MCDLIGDRLIVLVVDFLNDILGLYRTVYCMSFAPSPAERLRAPAFARQKPDTLSVGVVQDGDLDASNLCLLLCSYSEGAFLHPTDD